MSRRIFITGGTGFFGKSILDCRRRGMLPGIALTILSRDPDAFCNANPELVNQDGLEWLKGDIRDFAFPSGHFDAIIHASTSAVTTIPDAEQTSVIVDGTRRIIQFAHNCLCSELLFTSSGAVYGGRSTPVSEDATCIPETAYGKGKLLAEELLNKSGLSVKIARCFAFVGPYLNREIHYAVGNFMRDALTGKAIVINGDGTPLRSYLYADDLVRWLFAILERGKAGRPYNVGSDASVSIRELAETVKRVAGSKSEIVVKGTSIPGARPSAYIPIVNRARGELGLEVSVDLESAIRLSL